MVVAEGALSQTLAVNVCPAKAPETLTVLKLSEVPALGAGNAICSALVPPNGSRPL